MYVLDEYELNTLFVKFSESSKSLNVLTSVWDKRSEFCVCSFMQKIIVIGGNINEESISSFIAYDINTNNWTYTASMYVSRELCILIASMNEYREDAPCAVFQGKVVVTGGWKVISGRVSFCL